MDELRIPTLTLAADVVFADGRQCAGRLFVPAAAPRHAGPTRASEWLNEPAEFFAFLPNDSADPVMVNKGEVLFVSVPAEANDAGSLDDVETPRPAVEVECAGRRFEGHLAIDMPAGQTRVLDYLNRAERFLTLRNGTRHFLFRKSGITQVFDRSGGAAG
jgi:hypothetical protein